MEPIRFRCPKCKRRLIIRDLQLIGQSIVCPKCSTHTVVPAVSSMEVDAWSTNKQILPANFDSTAITKIQESITGLDLSLPSDPATVHTPEVDIRSVPIESSSEAGRSAARVYGDIFEDGTFENSLAASELSLDDLSFEDPLASISSSGGRNYGAVDRATLGKRNRDKNRTQRSWLLISTIGLATSLLALAIFILFVRNLSPREVLKKENGDGVPANVKGGEKAALHGVEQGVHAERNNAEKKTPETVNSSDPNAKTESDLSSPLASASDKSSLPDVERPDGKSNVAGVVESNGSDASVSSLLNSVGSSSDALDLQNKISTEKSDANSESTNAASKSDQQSEVADLAPPAGLQQFAPIFDIGSAPSINDAMASEKSSSAFDAGGGVVDIGAITHPPAVTPLPWYEARSKKILSLTAKDKSINQLLTLLSTFTGQSIPWDYRKLHWTVIDVDQRLDFQIKNGIADAELDKLLKAANCSLQSAIPRSSNTDTEDDELGGHEVSTKASPQEIDADVENDVAAESENLTSDSSDQPPTLPDVSIRIDRNKPVKNEPNHDNNGVPSEILTVMASPEDSLLEVNLPRDWSIKDLIDVPTDRQQRVPDGDTSRSNLRDNEGSGLAGSIVKGGRRASDPKTDELGAKLAERTKQTQRWVELFKNLQPTSSESWSLIDDSIVWNQKSTVLQKCELAVMLDQIRMVLNVAPTSGFATAKFSKDFDKQIQLSWMHPNAAWQAANDRLQNTGESVLTEPMNASMFLLRAAEECEWQLLIDWHAINTHGFSSGATTLGLLRNRSLPQIAKRILDQYDLVLVVDSPSRLILTTLAAQRKMYRFQVRALRENETLNAVVDSYRPLSPTDHAGHSTLFVAALPGWATPTNERYVIVRHCAPNTKQFDRAEIQTALGLK